MSEIKARLNDRLIAAKLNLSDVRMRIDLINLELEGEKDNLVAAIQNVEEIASKLASVPNVKGVY